MGGDFAPQSAVAGSVLAIQEKPDLKISLVGEKESIQSELDKYSFLPETIQIVHAPDVISMYDSPTKAIKTKPDSSIVKGLQFHKDGKADGFISMGNTGAVMTIAIFTLGRIKNVKRPTIGAFFPNPKNGCLVLDVGASLEVRPIHLFQFAIMGEIFYSHLFNLDNIRVGLLNVGEEKGKGTQLHIAAHQLLSKLPSFIGNVEGRDILSGAVDVVVCDGFSGNLLLKFASSIFPFVRAQAGKFMNNKLAEKTGLWLMKDSLSQLQKSLDYQEYGGVPLLGVNGTVVIGHGKSSPKAFKNAILNARKMIRENINGIIRSKLSESLDEMPKTTHSESATA
ncbi:MAG: phosphate acyltransferase PlsX [Candidatus Marinimicrobia bacterium]|nr:phosphate acyltransferase PlsX [Candidatus Neomarinimicrobiota bacterium]